MFSGYGVANHASTDARNNYLITKLGGFFYWHSFPGMFLERKARCKSVCLAWLI
jgi:hypothetical protein